MQYSLEDPDKEVLDFGTLVEKAVMSMVFSVHNVNPIRVRQWWEMGGFVKVNVKGGGLM